MHKCAYVLLYAGIAPFKFNYAYTNYSLLIRAIILNRKFAHSFFELTCVIHLPCQSFPPFHETRKHCRHFSYSCEWAGNGDVNIYTRLQWRAVSQRKKPWFQTDLLYFSNLSSIRTVTLFRFNITPENEPQTCK